MSELEVRVAALNIIKKEEGWRSRPYYCSAGHPTVGYGIKVGNKGDPLPNFELSDVVGAAWLGHEVSNSHDAVKRMYPNSIGVVRLAVLVSMCYQLGERGLRGFVNTNMFIWNGDFNAASIEMLDSKWAKQTPARAKRHSDMMRDGVLLDYYL